MTSMIQRLCLALALSRAALATPASTSKVSVSTSKIPTSTSKAAPVSTSSAPLYAISQVAEFDNIAGLLGVAVAPVGDNSIYENLKWNGFSLAATQSPATPGVPGLNPQSAPNYVAFAQGDVQGLIGGTATLTVNYPDSSIVAFGLQSFYYGCTLGTEESLASDPISCTITVTGYGPPSAGSPQIATQSFNFAANGLSQDMIKGIFSPAFTGLYSAVFALSSAETALTAGLIDNVANTIFSNSVVVVN